MQYSVINRDNTDFIDFCSSCENNIVLENLRVNGGTLNYSNLTYSSDLLILCINHGSPVGFCSLVGSSTTGLYVYQIAVKREYQRKGIGTELVERAKQLAHTLGVDLSAHVRDYNTNSQRTFEKCGFKKSDVYSTNDNYYYYYKTLNNDIGVSEKGLN